MTQPVSFRSYVPQLRAPARFPAPAPTPEPPPPSPPEDFERALRQAILMTTSGGGDARGVAVDLFWRAQRAGSTLERSIVMGANTFERISEARQHAIPIGIGRDCQIRNAIVDFNARIGDGCRLLNEAGIAEADTENYAIRGGIIVVPKNAELAPGTVI